MIKLYSLATPPPHAHEASCFQQRAVYLGVLWCGVSDMTQVLHCVFHFVF